MNAYVLHTGLVVHVSTCHTVHVRAVHIFNVARAACATMPCRGRQPLKPHEVTPLRPVPAGIPRPPYADSGKLPKVDRKPQVHNAQVGWPRALGPEAHSLCSWHWNKTQWPFRRAAWGAGGATSSKVQAAWSCARCAVAGWIGDEGTDDNRSQPVHSIILTRSCLGNRVA